MKGTASLVIVGAPWTADTRAARIDALAVDRSRYQDGSGALIELRMTPLQQDEQDRKGRCEERVRQAKTADDGISVYHVLKFFLKKPTRKGRA